MLKWNWKLFLVLLSCTSTHTHTRIQAPTTAGCWLIYLLPAIRNEQDTMEQPAQGLHASPDMPASPLHTTHPIFSWSCLAVAHAATNTVGAPAIGKTSYCFMSSSQRQKKPHLFLLKGEPVPHPRAMNHQRNFLSEKKEITRRVWRYSPSTRSQL